MEIFSEISFNFYKYKLDKFLLLKLNLDYLKFKLIIDLQAIKGKKYCFYRGVNPEIVYVKEGLKKQPRG